MYALLNSGAMSQPQESRATEKVDDDNAAQKAQTAGALTGAAAGAVGVGAVTGEQQQHNVQVHSSWHLGGVHIGWQPCAMRWLESALI